MKKSASSIPKREEIPSQFKWKLTDMYPSDDLWEKDFKICLDMSEKIQSFADTMTTSPDELLQCLDYNTEMERLSDKVYVYAHMSSHQDTTDSYYQELADRADSLKTKIASASSFIVPKILSIPDDRLNEFIEKNDKLKFYKRFLDEISRIKPHILSEKEEQILALSSEISRSPGTIFNMLNNADLKFPVIKDENGNDVEVTKGRYISLMENPDRRVRKDAFEALYSTYEKHINTIASTLSANVKANIFNSTIRKYSSAREASLFQDNIPVEVYDNLIAAVHNNLKLMHRYVSLRKKMLNLDELHMYDIYTPMVKDVEMEIKYEEAVELVKKGVSPLGETYISDLTKAFESGWIDVYENVGKRSGAYSWGCYDSHPYVLLNHNDTIDGMFTLAHEMGHAMHSFYSKSTQPYLYSQYKIFVAEVASTLNEALLMNYMLKNTKDKKEKMYLLNHYMEQFRGTVFRQTMFAEFEKIIHEKAEAGESLTATSLSNIYRNLNAKYFGPDAVIDDYIALEWARIPHFYTSFYVYKYATGFSAAISLSQQILNEGTPAVERYLNFLKGGGSDYPLNLLKSAGVDMTSPEPINNALKVFESLLDEMEELI
ncbi:oligopeptidase PepB [Fervidicella metallireducens AeB]|uniref:Oligopeptidase F n=1 Tax=Fervidicella metallireducens AeB TaxID=1403537 RepID=A0A017RT14_9CLOT|nr:oligoendopeptidase F [Fervidicella metallireducens]EYE87564.1 oligopeptidase PepB [Fervidicella metallireducens AeB]